MRVLIVGGGIGGLTAAIALSRAADRGGCPIDVRVVERAPGPRESGAGISIWGNAIRALRGLGADGAVVGAGEIIRTAEVRTRRGRLLSRFDVAAADAALGAPSIIIHRADLLGALLSQVPARVARAMRFGSGLVGVEQDGAGVTAHFDAGPPERADVLIGADGANSAVRTALWAGEFGGRGARNRFVGETCWRTVVEYPVCAAVPRGYVCEAWGRGLRFGIHRVGADRVFWWATRACPPGCRGGPDRAARATLRSIFADWFDPIPALIDRADPDAILRHDLYDRAPSRRWGRGRVTLIGDAAHPTTPNLGQSGCMAIEDAVVLARHLGSCAAAGGDAAAALRDYERERYRRTARITVLSHRLGRVGVLTARPLCALRDALVAATPGRMMLSSHNSIVGFDVWRGVTA